MAPKTDPRVDAYVAGAADFARPILEHLRATVHAACPECEETIKWGFPHFLYEGMLCSMAAFKAHCAFAFWKDALVLDEKWRRSGAMGHLGKITKIRDLPPKKMLLAWLELAVKLNEEGSKSPRRRILPKPPVVVPKELAAALKKSARAAARFASLSPSHQRKYADWIAGAKREETRERRLARAMKQITEGKSLSWKYER